jgi:hypothetical protein
MVDSQIKVTDAEVKKLYEEHFVPRWGLEGMQFKDETAAKNAWQELNDGLTSIDSLIARDAESGGPVKTSETWLRPGDLDKSPKWKAIYADLSIGDVVDPERLGQSNVLWYLKSQKGGDEEDFAREREGIRKNLWDEKARDLTSKLIARLRDKYEVKVDEERLGSLDIFADPAAVSDAPVITTNKKNVSEKEFVQLMQRVLANRPTLNFNLENEANANSFKKETAINVIAQSVTNWEALDRHYEEKEPFKWTYEFNRDHRLGRLVIRNMIDPEVIVTDDETVQEYEQNISRYSVPEQLRVFIIDETQGPLVKVWADVAVGVDFEKSLGEHFEKSPNMQFIPFNHLDSELKAVVKSMKNGETSKIFNAQGSKVMVHLNERVPAKPLPFERLKDSIYKSLFEKKRSQLLNSYLDRIKAASEIEVQQREWRNLRDEIGGE